MMHDKHIPIGRFAGEDELRRKRQELKRKLIEHKQHPFSIADVSVVMPSGKLAYGPPPTEYKAYKDIEYALRLVIESKLDFVTVAVHDYYVQFCLSGNQLLLFEAVSELYIADMGDKDEKFKQLGFVRDRNGGSGNYEKHIPLSTVSTTLIAKEIEAIFTTMYNMPFVDYEITEGK